MTEEHTQGGTFTGRERSSDMGPKFETETRARIKRDGEVQESLAWRLGGLRSDRFEGQ